MEGIQVYRIYQSLKLHFTKEDYDVFKHRGRIKISPERFQARNDRILFEKLGEKYQDIKLVQYISSNLMYGHTKLLYDRDLAEKLFTLYIKRRQSITQIFDDDVNFILDEGRFSNLDVLNYLIRGKITLESVRILDDYENIVDSINNSLFNTTLLRLKKAKGFVKYDTRKTDPIYKLFQEVK